MKWTKTHKDKKRVKEERKKTDFTTTQVQKGQLIKWNVRLENVPFFLENSF